MVLVKRSCTYTGRCSATIPVMFNESVMCSEDTPHISASMVTLFGAAGLSLSPFMRRHLPSRPGATPPTVRALTVSLTADREA